MSEKRYNLINNALGWLAFAIALFVYFSTLEPTTPLWDCGEFIAASYKLQVVHPPGAPMFLMINRVFSMLAPSQEWVAVFTNGQSALSSALAILFLFWTTSALARKIKLKNKTIEESSAGDVIAIMGSALVGATAFTFSDTFWFSAVESEVYALSSLIMAAVFWLMLKWERRADQPGNIKWILLISFLMGLSIGVHLLSLLVIPPLAFIYYFKKYNQVTNKGLLITGVIGLGILAFMLQIVVKTLPYLGSKVELLFVNSFGLPFWSGILFTAALVLALLAYGIYYTYKHQRVVINIVLTAITFILIGFSTYSMVVIRSLADPSIDMNNPETVFNLISYLNREQYGDRPLLYGPDFTAEVVEYEEGEMEYRKGKERYIATGKEQIPKYDPDHKTLFPRLGSSFRSDRKKAYRQWTGLEKGQKPTFADNIGFFFNYQLGHMYWRYFAWNFIGRQNDEQGHGELIKGNWISGIDFMDETFANVGPQENLPYFLKNNKARNTLYFLPFIFGLIGLFYHFKANRKDAFTVLVFFLMTGIILIIYLNQPPVEPRERDYTFVGSFYSFAIWIGLAVLPIIDYLSKLMNYKVAAAIATVASLVLVPSLMAKEEWNDHDRSGRYTSRDYAMNYLESCDKNAVLFTNGDNDTYPLWYVQEVEGFRDDVRVINLQLLMTDWYIEQLRRKANDSEPLPFDHFSQEKLVQGTRDYVAFRQEGVPGINENRHYNINKILEFIASNKQETQLQTQGGERLNFYPTKKLKIPVNKQKVLESGLVSEKNADKILDNIKFKLKKGNLMKSDLVLMDLIASAEWTRPIYFSQTAGSSNYLHLDDYMQQEGLTYKLVPIDHSDNPDRQPGGVNPTKMYNTVMNKFQWGRLNKEKLHVGSVTRRHCKNYRRLFVRLANNLIRNNQNEKAVKALDKCLEVIPEHNAPYQVTMVRVMNAYYKAGAPEKGKELAERLKVVLKGNLDYFLDMNKGQQQSVKRRIQASLYGLNQIQQKAKNNGQETFGKEVEEILNNLQSQYRGGNRRRIR